MNVQPVRPFVLTMEHAADVCRAFDLPAPASLRRAAKGEVSASFFLTFADGERAVLKVYWREGGAERLGREQAALAHLRRSALIPAPAWSHVDAAGELLGVPCVVMQRRGGLDGDDLWYRLDAEHRGRLLRRAGALLAEIHRLSLHATRTALATAGVPAAGEWGDRLGQDFEQALDYLLGQDWLDPRLLEACRSVWDNGAMARQAPFVPTLIHGDFQLWNLRVDPHTLEIVGLLDLESAAIGPGVTDVRDLELNLFVTQPWLRQHFWNGYGTPEPAGLERERLRQSALARALCILAAYRGPTANITPRVVAELLNEG